MKSAAFHEMQCFSWKAQRFSYEKRNAFHMKSAAFHFELLGYYQV